MAIAPAAASVVFIGFSGTINYVEEGLPLDSELMVGAPFSGVYSYDTSAVDLAPEDPILGGYHFPDHAMTVMIGDQEISQSSISLTVYNYSFFDVYGVHTLSPFFAFGLEWELMDVYLVNDTGTALIDDSLPLTAPDLNDFAYSSFSLDLPFQGATAISGEITWMGLVPEPGTLLALSAGALLVVRRDSRGRFDGRYGRVN